MNKTQKLFSIALIILLFSLPAFSQSLKVGSNAPDFSLQLQQDGKASDKIVTLNFYKGKVLFLHFWATWCPPCKVELPHMESLAKKLASQGDKAKMEFLAVCISDSQKALTSFMQKNGYTFPSALDEPGLVAMKYGIQGVPTSILISPEGKILKIQVGMMNQKQLENFVADYM
ncbi:MAG: TlpA family protein disulfide reductase [Spirochaetaceae bacterium]|nr:TlpA family protein disulfide reductase [Spirochaetaceae bacterium]